MKCLKLAILTVVVAVVLPGCTSSQNGRYAATAGGSTDGDAVVAVGKIVDSRAEVGLTAVFYAVEDDHYTPAVGPYGVYLVREPLPVDVQKDWLPFAGGALLVETEDFGLVPKAVAGVIYKPTDKLSPVYMAEKAWPAGNISSADISERGDDVFHWFALRYNF